jgi:integrase
MKAKSLDAGKYADGQGLWLFKRNRDAGKWILRITVSGRRREMGLGPWPDVSIAEARERAAEARRTLRDGLDPIVERQKQKIGTHQLTMSQAVESCFVARQAELKNDGIAGRWLSPLSVHVLPKIGNYPVQDIDQHVLKSVLGPIWHLKADVARKALNRINLTLKHAAALGLEVDLQATMKVRALLGKQRHEATHIPSISYQDMPAFYSWLSERNSPAAIALRFLILTGARTSEVRLATSGEIEGDIWFLAAGRTKTGQENRIPLSKSARDLIVISKQTRTSSAEIGQYLLFPSATGKPLSDMAMAKLMKDNGYKERPHGFRSSFRTWMEEQTDASYEVKETAIGHKVGSDTVRAYQRSDHLEKRRVIMEEWSKYLMSG